MGNLDISRKIRKLRFFSNGPLSGGFESRTSRCYCLSLGEMVNIQSRKKSERKERLIWHYIQQRHWNVDPPSLLPRTPPTPTFGGEAEIVHI